LLSINVKFKAYKTIILPTVSYGCETCSLTSRKKQRLEIFEKRMLRRISGPKGDEIMRSWRKLHNELHKLDSSPNIRISISRRWAGHVAHGKDMHKKFFSAKIAKMSSFTHRGI
jgi:hypothetical protein